MNNGGYIAGLKQLAVASALALASNAALAERPVAEGDMKRYCQGEAASKFNVSPRDITTLPLERTDSGYSVSGQYRRNGSKLDTFECRFNRDREFRSVRSTIGTSHGDSQYGSNYNHNNGGYQNDDNRGPRQVRMHDMPAYCRSEAAGKFNQSPRYITTQPAVKDDGEYRVVGHLQAPGHKAKKFVCKFNKQGVLKKVKQKD